jgi:hypothetical protein
VILLALIRHKEPNELVFPDLVNADWLLWKVPSLRGHIAYDGRPELLTRRQWNGVVQFERQERGWQTAVRGYSLIVTSPAIAQRVVKTGRWQRIYADKVLAVLKSANGG